MIRTGNEMCCVAWNEFALVKKRNSALCTGVFLLFDVSFQIVTEFILFWSEYCTGLSKKMDGIWNRYNLKSTGRIYTFGVLKCSEKFKVLDLP